MSGCTETGKISILLAVYEPREDWLREQLLSLDAQSYPNLKLYIRDDASPSFPFGRLQALVSDCIRSFPVELRRNEKNLGSNATFAALVSEAEGDYFAFCDQDDIWLPDKLRIMQEALERERALLVCSDQRIIDADGSTLAEGMAELRRHHVYRSGEHLGDTLWRANFASGCATLVRADAVRASLPWNPYMVYDHYIALWCGEMGKIVSLPEALTLHREHGGNQSSLLRGVEDKKSYYRARVEEKLASVAWLREHFPSSDELAETLTHAERWFDARAAFAKGDLRGVRPLWRERHFGRAETAFELLLPVMPERVFRAAITLARKNRL